VKSVATLLLATTIVLCSVFISYAKSELKTGDFVIASLELGIDLAKVKKAYPDVKFIKNQEEGQTGTTGKLYGTDGLRLFFVNTGKGFLLSSISVTSDKYGTTKNIKVGNLIDKVTSAYGEPDMAFSDEFSYITYSKDGKELLFSLDMKKKVVKEIIIRSVN